MIERAVLMSRLPGVTLAEVTARFGITKSALSKARKQAAGSGPSTADIALAALTRNGEDREGTLGDLAKIGEFLDYVCKDPHSAAGVRALLETFVVRGVIAIDSGSSIVGETWRLLAPWP